MNKELRLVLSLYPDTGRVDGGIILKQDLLRGITPLVEIFENFIEDENPPVATIPFDLENLLFPNFDFKEYSHARLRFETSGYLYLEVLHQSSKSKNLEAELGKLVELLRDCVATKKI